MTIEDIKKSFINNLKQLMSEHNKTQSDIAKIAGVSQGTVSDWLSGKKYPRMDKIQKIVDHFQLPITALVNDGKETNNQYYLNPETARLAQEVYDNPDLRILFDASRHLTPEDIRFVVEMVKKMKGLKD